jgi:hypothetical protein
LRNCGRIFLFPDHAIGTITRERAYLRTRGGKRGLTVSRPPHIVLDAAGRFAVYTEEFVAVPPRQIGISGKPETAKVLKALSLFLVSDFSKYCQFFTSPAWGIKGERGDLRSLKELPVPFAEIGDDELSRWERLHADAVRLRQAQPNLFDRDTEGGKTPEEIDRELNEMTYAALGLSDAERWLVEDLAHVRIELDEGKLGAPAVDPPKEPEIKAYAQALCAELDSFLGAEEKQHEVRVEYDGHSGMVQTGVVQSGRSRQRVTVEKADRPTAKAFAQSRDLLRQQYSQWVYFDRRLLVLDGEKTFLFKPLQRFHWTRGQALNDADLIIGETIAGGEEADVNRV